MTIGPHTPMPQPIVLTERGVGARIREARNRRRFRQVDVADLAFIPPARLSAIETAKASPTAREMSLLAQALGVSPRDFFPPVGVRPNRSHGGMGRTASAASCSVQAAAAAVSTGKAVFA